jgi:hypothetical protein
MPASASFDNEWGTSIAAFRHAEPSLGCLLRVASIDLASSIVRGFTSRVAAADAAERRRGRSVPSGDRAAPKIVCEAETAFGFFYGTQ